LERDLLAPLREQGAIAAVENGDGEKAAQISLDARADGVERTLRIVPIIVMHLGQRRFVEPAATLHQHFLPRGLNRTERRPRILVEREPAVVPLDELIDRFFSDRLA